MKLLYRGSLDSIIFKRIADVTGKDLREIRFRYPMGLFGPNVKKLARNKDLQGLMKCLTEGDSDLSHDAAEAIGNMGQIGYEPLIQTLNHPNNEVRMAALFGLEALGDSRAISHIIECMKADYDGVRQRASGTLSRWSEDVIDPLIECVYDQNQYVREGAVSALGFLQNKRAVPILLKALDDKDWGRHSNIILSLEFIGDNRAVPALIKALENIDTRENAASALGCLGDKRAIEPLKKALRENDQRQDEDQFDIEITRDTIVGALNELGNVNPFEEQFSVQPTPMVHSVGEWSNLHNRSVESFVENLGPSMGTFLGFVEEDDSLPPGMIEFEWENVMSVGYVCWELMRSTNWYDDTETSIESYMKFTVQYNNIVARFGMVNMEYTSWCFNNLQFFIPVSEQGLENTSKAEKIKLGKELFKEHCEAIKGWMKNVSEFDPEITVENFWDALLELVMTDDELQTGEKELLQIAADVWNLPGLG